MGPMNGFEQLQMRQADPALLQASLQATQVAPNRSGGLFAMLRKNPMLGQIGLGLMQAGRPQPVMGPLGRAAGPMQVMMPLMQGLLTRRG